MGIFDGYLFCTDLDDTLLTDDKRVSEENKRAIDYFVKEGGLFTFATGRVPRGVKHLLKYVMPNAPMVCFNGGYIYDFEKDKYLWTSELDENAIEVVEYVDKNYPPAGIDVCTRDNIYLCKVNRIVEEHKMFEMLDDNYIDYHQVEGAWSKVLFMMESEYIPGIKKLIDEAGFKERYNFVQSSPWYYELLPKGATKGNGLLKLAEILGIDPSKTIGMGDNENDLDLVKKAALGVAVGNAAPIVKEAADIVTVSYKDHAAAAVIEMLEKKIKG